MASHELRRSTVTNQIAFDQQNSNSIPELECTMDHFRYHYLWSGIQVCLVKEVAKRKIFARDPTFGPSCVPKSLPLKDSPITRVLQVARRIKIAKTGGQLSCPKHKTAKIWVKIGVNGLK